MEGLPPLVIADFSYTHKGKPVLLVSPTGDVMEFGAVETAICYLDNARKAGAPNADESVVFRLDAGRWIRVGLTS